MSPPYRPQHIVVEQSVQDNPLTRTILSRLEDVPVEWVRDPQMVLDEFHPPGDRLTEGKKILMIARQRGRFLKPCPGTHHYICCGYFFINLATNCDLECSYCVLQGYLNNPFLVVYVNVEDLFRELDAAFRENPRRFFRVGTGELTDSLTLDHITGFTRLLVPYFAERPNAILELKTKTTRIENLLGMDPKGRVVVSWSLSPNAIIEKEERGAPRLEERLEAAKRCQRAGYWIGFHFDPMIHYPGWERDYQEVVDRVFQTVDSRGILWISLGAFRYPPPLAEIIRQRHPDSRVLLGELFPGKDGKLRYFRPIRAEMFRKMVSWIKGYDPQVTVYLCMESPEVWRYAFRDFPEATEVPLPELLDRACFSKFKIEITKRELSCEGICSGLHWRG